MPWIAVVPSYRLSILASRMYCSIGKSWMKPEPPKVCRDSVEQLVGALRADALDDRQQQVVDPDGEVAGGSGSVPPSALAI